MKKQVLSYDDPKVAAATIEVGDDGASTAKLVFEFNEPVTRFEIPTGIGAEVAVIVENMEGVKLQSVDPVICTTESTD